LAVLLGGHGRWARLEKRLLDMVVLVDNVQSLGGERVCWSSGVRDQQQQQTRMCERSAAAAADAYM
jgi:hypothetical protein